jgi:hypothetical protein
MSVQMIQIIVKVYPVGGQATFNETYTVPESVTPDQVINTIKKTRFVSKVEHHSTVYGKN